MKNDETTRKQLIAGLLLASFAALLGLNAVLALPSAARIDYNATDYGPTLAPGNITTERGTITTLILHAAQQNQNWKGYVGNVTGALTLEDAAGYAIYDWSLTGVTIIGEVYTSRHSGVNFGSVDCANTTVISDEQVFHNMTSTQVDNINKTFNWTTHKSFLVGTVPIANSTCRVAYTYINDTPQAASEAASFQEILLQDNAGALVYMTSIENNLLGFDNRTYDFQMIVAESAVKSTATTYYFWTEIST